LKDQDRIVRSRAIDFLAFINKEGKIVLIVPSTNPDDFSMKEDSLESKVCTVMEGIINSLINANSRNELLSAVEILGNLIFHQQNAKSWLANSFRNIGKIISSLLEEKPFSSNELSGLFSNIGNDVLKSISSFQDQFLMTTFTALQRIMKVVDKEAIRVFSTFFYSNFIHRKLDGFH